MIKSILKAIFFKTLLFNSSQQEYAHFNAFTFSRDQLIKETKEKAHGSHNKMVGLNAKVKGLIAKVNTFEELPEYFLRFARKNNYPIVLIGNR